MLNGTFSSQFLSVLKKHFETDAPKEQLAKARDNEDSGYISRVFNDLDFTVSNNELRALITAREDGLIAFASVISQQIEPIIKKMFNKNKPFSGKPKTSLFEKLYATYFSQSKTSTLSEAAVQEKIIQAIIEQYGEAVISKLASEKRYASTPEIQAVIGNSINIIAASITTPETVTRLARSDLNNPALQAHLDTIKNGESKYIYMKLLPNLERFKDILQADMAGLDKIKPTSKQIEALMELMNTLCSTIDKTTETHVTIAETLPKMTRTFSAIRHKINELPIEDSPETFKTLRENTLDSLQVLTDQFVDNLQSLEKSTLPMIDLKLNMPLSKLFKTLNKQLNTLETLVNNNEILLRENSALAQHAQTAINTIAELKHTLLKEADNIPADNLAAALPQLTQKILTLNNVLQQTFNDISSELSSQKTSTTRPLRQKILNTLEPILKAVGNFIQLLTGYTSEGVAKRQLKENVEVHLTLGHHLEDELAKVRLTNQKSPAVLTNPPGVKAKSLVADFQRALGNDELSVNGKLLSEYAADFHDFDTENDVLRFLQEVILKDVSGDKTPMLLYLKENFHQNGLLYPVTSSLQKTMVEHTETGEFCFAALRGATLTKKTDIVTNNNGFTIQEHIKADSLFVFPTGEKNKKNPLYELSEDKITLSAARDGVPILEAQGTIQVDFSQNSAEPTLTAIENTITYGHPALALKMEKAHQSQLTKSPSNDGLSDAETELDNWSPPDSPTNTPDSGSSTPTAF